MEKRNPSLRPKEGNQPRDRTGGRGRCWDGAGHANTVPKQLPPFPSSRQHHRQPQDSHGDRPSSPSSTVSSRSIRSHVSLAQGAQGKGPPWSRTSPAPRSLANSTAARSKRRRERCSACSGMGLEPQQQHRDHGWMDEAPLVPQPCSHIISHILAPAANAGGSPMTPANTSLSFLAYEGVSFPGPEQELFCYVKQEAQPETPAQEAESAVPQRAEQETQTEEPNSAPPLLVNRETQTETLTQEEEKSASPRLINQATQIESPLPRSPSTHSFLLSIDIDLPAGGRRRLSLLRRALRLLSWASRCPCMARHPDGAGARRHPGDGCCSEPAKHPRGGGTGAGAGTGTGAAPQAFPAADGTALPPCSWPWLIETSL